MANRPRSLVRRHAGTGLEAGSGGTLDVDLYELTEKTVPVMADSVSLVDSADDSSAKATLTNVLKILGETAAGSNATSGLSEVDGVLKINVTGTTANTAPATTDKLLIEVTGVNKSVTIANAIKAIGEAMINAAVATNGLAETDGVIKIDIGNVTPTTAPAPADKLLIEVTGVNKSTSITNFVKAVGEAMVNAATATSGISEVDGVVKIDIGTVTATTAPAVADLMLVEVGGVNKSASITNLQKAFGEVAAGAAAATGLTEVDGVLKIDPTDELAVLADGFVLTQNAAGAPHKEAVADLIGLVAGTQASSALTAASGVLKVAPADETLVPSTGYLATVNAAGETHKDLVSDVAALMAGTGLGSSGGVLSAMTPGAVAVGRVKFGAIGDGDVTVGVITYDWDAAPDATAGEWTEGATPEASATNLAAAINGDLRNSSGPYYAATADGDTVYIYALAAGTAGNVAITRAAAEPATMENLVGGLAAAAKKQILLNYTVTALDVDTAVLVNVPLPFVPTKFVVQIRTSTGLPRVDVTDLFTIGTTPNRIIATGTGGTHLVAGDTLHIHAEE